MKRLSITAAVILAALVPAVIGLWGNASFSQGVPVLVPASGQVVTVTATPTTVQTATPIPDDHGGLTPRDDRTEPGDDRDTPTVTSTTPAATPTVDDHGGRTPRDDRTEAGDDRRPATSTSTSSSGSGGGSGSGSDSGSSGSGSGHDDRSGSDDGHDDRSGSGGSGGHGSDD